MRWLCLKSFRIVGSLICAWNEFDESGWLAPALPPPDGEGAAKIEALRKVLLGDK